MGRLWLSGAVDAVAQILAQGTKNANLLSKVSGFNFRAKLECLWNATSNEMPVRLDQL
jgi:hypothetical protein